MNHFFNTLVSSIHVNYIGYGPNVATSTYFHIFVDTAQVFQSLAGMGEGFEMRGGREETYDLEGGDGVMAFSDKTVRRGFIKKVYSIISVQVSACLTAIEVLNNPLNYSSWSLLDLLLSSIKAKTSGEFKR